MCVTVCAGEGGRGGGLYDDDETTEEEEEEEEEGEGVGRKSGTGLAEVRQCFSVPLSICAYTKGRKV